MNNFPLDFDYVELNRVRKILFLSEFSSLDLIVS